MPKFEPMYDRVLVKVLDEDTRLGDIDLPDDDRKGMLKGIVVSVGEGYVDSQGNVKPLRLQVGDLITFGPHAGMPVIIEGVEFRSMREGEVIGRIRE